MTTSDLLAAYRGGEFRSRVAVHFRSDRSLEVIDLSKLRNVIEAETSGLDINAVWLFGSEASGKARADSDVDLALLPSAPIEPVSLLDLQERISNDIGRPVQVIDLRRASPILAVQATYKGVLLTDRNATERHRFVASLLSRREDVIQMRRDAEHSLLRRFGVGR